MTYFLPFSRRDPVHAFNEQRGRKQRMVILKYTYGGDFDFNAMPEVAIFTSRKARYLFCNIYRLARQTPAPETADRELPFLFFFFFSFV